MKSCLAIGFFLLSTFSNAQTFKPESGMNLKCFDDVSSLTYLIKITDAQGHIANINAVDRDNFVTIHESVTFKSDLEGTSFNVVLEDQWSNFSLVFPGNDLLEAYYMDGGDSRALDCEIISR